MKIYRFPMVLPLLYLAMAQVAFAFPNYARHDGASCFTCHTKSPDRLKNLDVSLKLTDDDTVYSLSGDGVRAGLSVHSTGNDAVLKDVTGVGDATVTGMYLNKDTNYQRGLNGLSGYIGGERFRANLGLFVPGAGFTDDNSQSVAHSLWYRFAYTPKLNDQIAFDLGVFGESATPASSIGSDSGSSMVSQGTETFGLDAKIKGNLGGVAVDLKATYLNSITNSAQTLAGSSIFGRAKSVTNSVRDLSEGYGASARLDLWQAFGLSATYRTYKSKNEENPDKQNLASVGAWLNISENTAVESQYTARGANNDILTEESAFTLLFIASF